MEKSMTEASATSNPPTLSDTSNAISSLDLASGVSRSDSQDGATTESAGAGAVRVRRSRSQEKRKHAQLVAETLLHALSALDTSSAYRAATHGLPTADISSLSSIALSEIDAQWSPLANRLVAQMELYGSPEFVLDWQELECPLGPPILQRRALVRRKNDSDSSGQPATAWPTPSAIDSTSNRESQASKMERGSGGVNLSTAAELAAWPTPNVPNGGRSPKGGMSSTGMTLDGKKRQVGLEQVAAMAPWPTPMVHDRSKPGAGHLESGGRERTLAVTAELSAPWPTPTSTDARSGARDGYMIKGHPGLAMADAVRLTTPPEVASWSTPSSRDWKDTPGMATTGINPDGSERTRLDQLPRQVGLTVNGSCAGTSPSEKGVAYHLNPRFSLWLQLGPYAIAWSSCAERVIVSAPKRPQTSSKRTTKNVSEKERGTE